MRMRAGSGWRCIPPAASACRKISRGWRSFWPARNRRGSPERRRRWTAATARNNSPQEDPKGRDNKTREFRTRRRMSKWRKFLRRGGREGLPAADLMQFEPLGRRHLSQMAYDYVRSGGGDEITMRENRQAFERL